MGNNHLTIRQAQIFEFLKDYLAKNKCAPYIREIQQGCAINSHKSVIDKLVALERKGFIKRKINKHKSIKLLPQRKEINI